VTRAAVLVLLAALLAVPAAEGGDEGTVLALVSRATRVELVRLEVRSLAPVGGAAPLRVGLHDIPWAMSPDGTQLALGSGRTTSVVFVDLRRMRMLGRVGIASSFITAVAWPAPNRFLMLERGVRRWRLAVVDPTTRRVLSRRTIGPSRSLSAAAAITPDGLAVLIEPGHRVGTPHLLLLDARGRARRVALPRIAAGMRKKKVGSKYRVWYRHPGLAVDAEAGRAYVVTAGSRVAVVDLATLAVTYREVRRLRSRAAAARSPEVLASGGNILATGTQRQAHWLGDGLIATSGWNEVFERDSRGSLVQGDPPAGLDVLDTRTWTSRRLRDDVRWFHATHDLVLASVPPRRRPGTAVAAFTHEGAARFRVEVGSAAFGLQSAGPYAYLGLGDAYKPHRVTVLDTRTGEVAGIPTVPGWVLLLSPSQPQFCRCYTGTTVG
jgi:hypothetical protein